MGGKSGRRPFRSSDAAPGTFILALSGIGSDGVAKTRSGVRT